MGNLAVAATALRNWAVARKAWEENGIALEGIGRTSVVHRPGDAALKRRGLKPL